MHLENTALVLEGGGGVDVVGGLGCVDVVVGVHQREKSSG